MSEISKISIRSHIVKYISYKPSIFFSDEFEPLSTSKNQLGFLYFCFREQDKLYWLFRDIGTSSPLSDVNSFNNFDILITEMVWFRPNGSPPDDIGNILNQYDSEMDLFNESMINLDNITTFWTEEFFSASEEKGINDIYHLNEFRK